MSSEKLHEPSNEEGVQTINAKKDKDIEEVEVNLEKVVVDYSQDEELLASIVPWVLFGLSVLLRFYRISVPNGTYP